MQNRIINLTFHGLGNPRAELEDEAFWWTSPDRYKAILDRAVGRDDVRITFDDGNVSDYEIGFPQLVDRDLKATFFVVAARLDQPHYLSRAQIREMLDAGMRIGTHGMRHRSWRGLQGSDLHEEIAESRERLEDALGASVDWAACPLGEYDRRSLKALRDAGYQRVFNSDEGPAFRGQWFQSRNSITRAHDDKKLDWIFGGCPGIGQAAGRGLKRFVKSLR